MSNLPSYLAAAKPVPLAVRAPWYKTIAPAYFGIMLWYVFWGGLVSGGAQHPAPGGVLAAGLFYPFVGVVVAALICHFLFYLVPGLLGMKTGLPLYVVGTSTYGARGGLLMPGLLMGLLQFGWLAVNAWAVATVLCVCFNVGVKPSGIEAAVPSWPHGIMASAFAVLAAFIGLKGIKYMARVATYLPLIPVVVLLVLLAVTWSGIGSFDLNKTAPQAPPMELALMLDNGTGPAPWTVWQIVGILSIYVVGFFATAGAAGVDIASNSRNAKDVHLGGIMGIFWPTVLAGTAAMLIVAGAYGRDMIAANHVGEYNPVNLIPDILGKRWGNLAMIGLAISALPGGCFSAMIAANSFKTTMPKVNPFISVGLGTLVAAILAVTGVAGNLVGVFSIIGASFGPVCGAMMADYFLSGTKWSGPRAGFNPAGWISWIVGFAVGAWNLVVNSMLQWDWATRALPRLGDWQDRVPVPPVAAFVVGFVLYVALSVVGLRTRKLSMPEIVA